MGQIACCVTLFGERGGLLLIMNSNYGRECEDYDPFDDFVLRGNSKNPRITEPDELAIVPTPPLRHHNVNDRRWPSSGNSRRRERPLLRGAGATGNRQGDKFSMSVFDVDPQLRKSDYHRSNAGGAMDKSDYGMNPIQCKSMLTCNNEFRKTFPYVHYALVKEVVNIERLAHEEMIIPLKQHINTKKELVFAEKVITSYLSGQFRAFEGKLPDINLGTRLTKKIVKHLWEAIEEGVEETERERTVGEVISRQDVQNEIKINQQFSASLGINAVMSAVEGMISIDIRQGTFFDLIGPKKVLINTDIVTKSVFLNGGQLAVLDRDPLFQDQVEIGENRNINRVVSPSSYYQY